MIITFLFCLGCAKENIQPTVPQPKTQVSAKTNAACPWDGTIEYYKTKILLIKAGVYPNTGCDRLKTCIQVYEERISFLKFFCQ